MSTDTLSQMGIENPGQIVRYTMRRRSPREDVLKIFYEREKGSLLPVSRTYRFGRSIRTSVGDSGEPRFEENFEISPVLLSAVEELDALIAKRSGDAPKDALLAEIEGIGAMLQSGGEVDRTALAERLDRLRERAKGL